MTITAISVSKTYGTLETFATAYTYAIQVNGNSIPVTGTVTDLLNGDTIAGVSETSTGASAIGSGPEHLQLSCPAARRARGWATTPSRTSTAQLTVTPATLTITANNDSKTYGTVKTLSATAYTETGLVTANGDAITGSTA